MGIDYFTMLEMVLKYCNQSFTEEELPNGLHNIIIRMCEYSNDHDNNVTSLDIGSFSAGYAGKSLFAVFADELALYKRVRML